jgi:coenzyme F420-dependent glucose-6-phosphate dehydrogenase
VSAETAGWAGGWADGLITVNQPADKLRQVVDAFRSGGGEGKPIRLQVHMALALDEATALASAHEQWASNVLDGSLCWELELPEHFEAATRHVRPGDVRDVVLISDDPQRLAATLAGYAELGFDAIYLHEVGRDQHWFIEVVGAQVLPHLGAGSSPPAGDAAGRAGS